MEEKNINKPLLDVESDLYEMSENVKIINSLKNDIEETISGNNSNNNMLNEMNISNIKEKYDQIKKLIEKFMKKKNHIYNFISDEKKIKKQNIIINDDYENQQLLPKNNFENATSSIKKMQNDIINKVSILEKKLKKIKNFENLDSLLDVVEQNDIKIIDEDEKDTPYIKSIKLSTKTQIYNEKTKELKNVVKSIESIKRGTKDIKLMLNDQDNMINNLNEDEHNIEDYINKGTNELKEKKYSTSNKNNNSLVLILSLILVIIIIIYIIYKKFFKKYK